MAVKLVGGGQQVDTSSQVGETGGQVPVGGPGTPPPDLPVEPGAGGPAGPPPIIEQEKAKATDFSAGIQPSILETAGDAPRTDMRVGQLNANVDAALLVIAETAPQDAATVRDILAKPGPKSPADRAVLESFYFQHVGKHPELSEIIRPAETRSPQQTQRAMRQVFNFIRSEARKRAATPREVDPNSKFVQRLEDHYLATYLDNPTPENGVAAIEEISKKFTGYAQDQWESLGLSFNEQEIPEILKMLRPDAPDAAAAGTDIISIENQSVLPYVDVPHLLGDLNPSRSIDTEVDYQGRNISDLLHWSSGVKYYGEDESTMRELFVGYEAWHLEQWDVFAEDPVNDIIVEDQGRILGRMLANAEINRDNLTQKLNEGFNEARAWMGSILTIRQEELDAQIRSPEPAETRLYFAPSEPNYPYGETTLTEQLAQGWDVESVKQWQLTDKYIELYTMIYEAETWQEEHGDFDNSRLLTALARGDLDDLMNKVRDHEEIPDMELAKTLIKIVDFNMLPGLVTKMNDWLGGVRDRLTGDEEN